MTFAATISRKKALDAAGQALEKANELTVKHNETIEEVGKIRNGLAGLQEHTEKRLNAQLEMIEGCETRGLATARVVSDLEKRLGAGDRAVLSTATAYTD